MKRCQIHAVIAAAPKQSTYRACHEGLSALDQINQCMSVSPTMPASKCEILISGAYHG